MAHKAVGTINKRRKLKMISIILGHKGSGKTKRLISCVNDAVETSKGNVVCVEKETKLTYDVNYRARLIATDEFAVKGYDAFYGFLSGLCAGDHDITDILIDATLKIGGRDYEALADFLAKVASLSTLTGTNFTFTISTEKANLPARIFEVCEAE
jgi:energy-coupling factor transporter ATP-binding protein EcfA2